MRLTRTLALLVVLGLAAGHIENVTRADSAPRLQALQRLHDDLHARLEQHVGRDPVVARVFADPGQIVVAVRAGLVEDLTTRVARQYLRQITLDLAAVETHTEGQLRKHTPIGTRRVGDWDVAVTVHKLVGRLRAGEPRLTFARNVLQVELPLEVQPASGQIGLRFSWDSASLVNLVCKDFVLDLDLEGYALRQQHVLRGHIELTANASELTATPVVPDPSFLLKVDLTPDSWARVEANLRSQDSVGRCGMFMEPERVLRDLHARVAKGVKITLPHRILRPVRLPARFERTVRVNDSVVQLALAGERLTASGSMLWSSTRVTVGARAPASRSR